jgi:predicted DNA-binding protein (MmcQ/YjbR family)
MTRQIVNTYAATLPGAVCSDPWGGGHDAWKVGGKMFADVGATEDYGVAVKCDSVETAQLLIDVGHALRAPYFHKSWVRLSWGLVDDDELRMRILTSYEIIRGKLSLKMQKALAEGTVGRPAES